MYITQTSLTSFYLFDYSEILVTTYAFQPLLLDCGFQLFHLSIL